MKKTVIFVMALVSIMVVAFIGTTAFAASDATAGKATVVEAKVLPGGYPDIVLEAGKSVRINFKVDAKDLNACNNEVIIPEWNIDQKLSAGDNYVDITPTKTGTFGYSCWMGMLDAKITVVAAGSQEVGALPQDASANYASTCPMLGNGARGGNSIGGCCGGSGGRASNWTR